MQPRMGVRLLPPTAAAEAVDTRGLSGYLNGRPTCLQVPGGTGFLPAHKKVFRTIDPTDDSNVFMTFGNRNTDVVRPPLTNDMYMRYYWAGEGIQPSFNTLQRIKDGMGAYFVGGQPAPRPTITIETAGVSPTVETRVYVLTVVDEFGVEGPPGGQRFTNPKIDDVLRVAWVGPAHVTGFPAISAVRVYRTVVGQNSTAFFFAAEVPLGTNFFVDNLAGSDVALNETLGTQTYALPPADMLGLCIVANGFLAGWKGRDVYFSEPYRPDAWPTEYIISVEDPIIGLGVFDTNLVILTTGVPYVATGVNPAAMSLTKVGSVNGCLSRRSIVSMPGAVIYASSDGLSLIDSGGMRILTQDMIDRNTWLTGYNPDDIRAVRDGDSIYTAWTDDLNGFEIDFREPERGVTFLTSGMQIDAFDQDGDGQRPLLMSDGTVYFYAHSDAPPSTYRWRSKEFFMVQPLNFGAAQVDNALTPVVTTPTSGLSAEGLRLRVWADRRLAYDKDVKLDQQFRLPSGFKAQIWQFELEGNVGVSRMMVAETGKELATL